MLTLYIYFIVDTPRYHTLTALQCSEALWQDSVRERKVGEKSSPVMEVLASFYRYRNANTKVSSSNVKKAKVVHKGRENKSLVGNDIINPPSPSAPIEDWLENNTL